MNEEEKEELKKLLLDLVEKNRQAGYFKILDDDIRLDEDRGFQTTEAEILVFGLPREYLPELHIAWDAYEVLIGLCSGVLPSRMEELLIKSRSICPPAKRLNISYEFLECLDFPDWFAWFAKEFFKMPTRGSFAFWEKQAFNTEQLRGVAIFAKACFGHPSPSKRQKLNATAYAFGAPAVLRTCHFATPS